MVDNTQSKLSKTITLLSTVLMAVFFAFCIYQKNAISSDDVNVHMRPGPFPTPETWNKAIKAAGFDLDIDTKFEWNKFNGFLPAKYKGHDAGFELYYGNYDLSTFPKEEQAELGNRSQVVSLILHGDAYGYISGIIAGAVLSSITDGRFTFGGELLPIKAKNAIQWAKNQESSLLAEDKNEKERALLIHKIITAQNIDKNAEQQMAIGRKALMDYGLKIYNATIANNNNNKPNPKEEAAFKKFTEKVLKLYSSDKIINAWSWYYGNDLSIKELQTILQYYESDIGRKDVAARKAVFSFMLEESKRIGTEGEQLLTFFSLDLQEARQ